MVKCGSEGAEESAWIPLTIIEVLLFLISSIFLDQQAQSVIVRDSIITVLWDRRSVVFANTSRGYLDRECLNCLTQLLNSKKKSMSVFV